MNLPQYPTPSSTFCDGLISEDCKIQNFTLSFFEPMQLTLKSKSWKSKIIFQPKQRTL